MNNRFIK